MISVPGLRGRRINTETKYETKKINNKETVLLSSIRADRDLFFFSNKRKKPPPFTL